jgi:hypothetical protein
VPVPLYNRLRHPGSLTTRPETANGSAHRDSVDASLAGLYRNLYRTLREDPTATARLDTLVTAFLTGTHRRKLAGYAEQIADFLREPSRAVLHVQSRDWGEGAAPKIQL